MDILFIHNNYPGQFRHIAPLLASDQNHRVKFLTANQDSIEDPQSRVEVVRYVCHRQVNANTHHYLTATEEAILQGQAVLRKIAELVNNGFIPKIIISHGGMGLGLFVKSIVPDAISIGYFEWYFREETTRNLVKSFDLDCKLKSEIRNLPILKELESCDIGVVPTKWQHSQFPEEYKDKLNIIFDGINTDFFQPCNKNREQLREMDIILKNRETKEKFILQADKNIISYATRGMEPLRGFPEFIKALPKLLKDDKNLVAVIAGADRCAYSYGAPSHDGSWKKHLMEEFKEIKNSRRVIFTGLLDYGDYRKLLWRTDLHCYLTREYVTSWSLFESVACGTRLAVNKNKATENIAQEYSISWLNIDDPEGLSGQIKKIMKNDKSKVSKILPGYELRENLIKWANLINNKIKQSEQSK